MPNRTRLVSAIAAAATVILVLGSCAEGSRDRELSTYVDPSARFAVRLPSTHTLRASEPSPATMSSPGLLAGVIASPAQASPSSTGLGGGLDLSSANADQTTFQVLVFPSDGFDSLSDMTLYFLTADPQIDVLLDEPMRVATDRGRLVVADLVQDGAARVEVAAAFSLGHDGVGYLIAAVFPAGGWESERDDFMAILDSFEPDVAPGLGALPYVSVEEATGA